MSAELLVEIDPAAYRRAALKERLRIVFAPDPERQALERSFAAFVADAWNVVEPATPMVPGFYLDAMCEHLQAVASGEIRNLLITIPPGFAKSTLVSVLYPAWQWIDHPEHRFLTTSHDGDLATRDAVRSRRVMSSWWYQQRWGTRFRMTGDQNVKSRYENDRTGYRVAAGVNAGLTGERADTLICDDPHSVKHVTSETIREATVRWWTETMGTRLNDPHAGSRIVIQQRVHAEDLAGALIDSGTYEHLTLPMEYEPTTAVTGIGWRDPRTEPGQLLHPERYDAAWVAEKKVEFGSAMWAGQFQQRPSPAEGGTFKRHWWKQRYRQLPRLVRVEQFLDSAFKTGVGNDFSVIATWGDDGQGNLYVLDVWRQRVEYPDLIRAAHDQYGKHQHHGPGLALVIEDKASGQSAIQTLSRPLPIEGGIMLRALPVIAYPIPAGASKESRAEGVSSIVEAGRVFLPEDAPWVADFIEEHASFPTGAHDDQVDTTAMALQRLHRDDDGVVRVSSYLGRREGA